LIQESGADVTIFVFEKAHHAQNEDRVNAARNVLKRLKALRHPHMLKFVDGVETETQIFVVVDAVQPLRFRATTLSPPVMAWGFHQIASALAFLHNDCKMIHANVHPGSLYCDRQGNWKLGGFELLYDIAAEGAPASTRRNSDLCPEQFADPYITAADWAMLAASPPSTADSWSLAALLYDAFQGPLLRRDQLAQLGKIPATLQAEYKKLMSQQVKTRLAVSAFLNSTFFAQQPFVRTMLFLEQMALKTPEEKDNFFQSLLEVIPTLPAECNRNYLLPQLRASIDFGAAVHPRALTCVLRLGSQLAAEDFAESIAPMLVKLFASNERQMRLCLLQVQIFSLQLFGDCFIVECVFSCLFSICPSMVIYSTKRPSMSQSFLT
jgi:SCY1-like protein 1